MHAKSLQLSLTLCDSMDSSPPGSYVHGILQARILEWVLLLLVATPRKPHLSFEHYYFLNITSSISLIQYSFPSVGLWVWQIFLTGQTNFTFLWPALFTILSPEECWMHQQLAWRNSSPEHFVLNRNRKFWKVLKAGLWGLAFGEKDKAEASQQMG